MSFRSRSSSKPPTPPPASGKQPTTSNNNSSSSNAPLTPRQQKVQDALDLFAKLQGVPFVEVSDSERLKDAQEARQQQQQLNTNTTNAASVSSTNASSAPQTTHYAKQLLKQVEALQKKIAVSDVLMKKLHKKNKELTTQNEALQLQLAGGGGGGDASAALASARSIASTTTTTTTATNATASTLSVEQLRQMIQKRDQEIIALRRQLQQDPTASSSGASVSGSAPRLQRQPLPEPTDPQRRPSATDDEDSLAAAGGESGEKNLSKHLQKRIQQLNSDYEKLLKIKLECITHGESTGKVNKEVKAFFTAMREKVLSDQRDFEEERALMHERLVELDSS